MKTLINLAGDIVYWLVVIILVIPMTIIDLFILIGIGANKNKSSNRQYWSQKR